MRRWVLFGGVVGFAAAVAFAPRVAVALVPGLAVGSGGWCATGVCLHEVTYGGIVAEHVAVDWDREARVIRPVVPFSGTVRTGLPVEGSATPGALAWLRRIVVTDATVEGLPLPPLSGEVWPERRLRGDKTEVDGDTVRIVLPTDYGSLTVQARQAVAGVRFEVSADVIVVPAGVLGDALPMKDVVFAGVYDDGRLLGTVSVGGLTLPIEGQRVGQGGRATLVLDRVPLREVYAVLRPVVPEARAEIEGAVSARVEVALEGAVLDVDVQVPEVQDFAVRGLVSDDLRSRFSYATRGVDGQPVMREAGPAVGAWIGLERVGAMMPAAVLAAEDAGFWTHPGFELANMVDAQAKNAEAGRVERGGSTLTQQLAKNLYLDGERTYVRKLRELLYAANLEGSLGKRAILETYLNIVEFGPGLYGVLAATDHYFLKHPSGLLPEEAAWLAGILPSPRSAYQNQYVRDRANVVRVHAILDNMITLSPQEREAAKKRGVHFVR